MDCIDISEYERVTDKEYIIQYESCAVVRISFGKDHKVNGETWLYSIQMNMYFPRWARSRYLSTAVWKRDLKKELRRFRKIGARHAKKVISELEAKKGY